MPPVLPLMKKPARLCLAAGTLFTLFLTPLAQGRTWTNLQGKKLEAEFIRLDGQKAVLKRSGGQTVSIPLSQLSWSTGFPWEKWKPLERRLPNFGMRNPYGKAGWNAGFCG